MSTKGAMMLHPSLSNRVRFNNISCLYEITERGLTYGMDFSQFQYFKAYFNRSGTMITDDSIENWYNHLDKASRKTISKTGGNGNEDGFYPD